MFLVEKDVVRARKIISKSVFNKEKLYQVHLARPLDVWGKYTHDLEGGKACHKLTHSIPLSPPYKVMPVTRKPVIGIGVTLYVITHNSF